MKKILINVFIILCFMICGCGNIDNISTNNSQDDITESNEYTNIEAYEENEESDPQINTVDEQVEMLIDDSSDTEISKEEIQAKVIEFERWLISNAYSNDVWYIEDAFAGYGDDTHMWMWTVNDSAEKAVIDSYLEYFWSVGIARTSGYSYDAEGNQIPDSVDVNYTITEEKFNIVTGTTDVVERDLIVIITVQAEYNVYDMVMYN